MKAAPAAFQVSFSHQTKCYSHCCMKTCLIIFAAFLSTTLCYSQEKTNRDANALSLELGKTGLIWNFNYDHKFKASNIGIRASAGSNFSRSLSAWTVGGGGYCIVARALELGVDFHYLVVDEVSDDQKGFTLIYPDYPTKTLYTSLNIGYRKYGRKTLFRVGLSPGIADKDFIPGGYISYGFTF